MGLEMVWRRTSVGTCSLNPNRRPVNTPVRRFLRRMKRRKTKKFVKRSEYHVAANLGEFLLNAEVNGVLSSLNCALVSLITARLQLDYPARARRWWVDDIEWTQVAHTETEVTGSGKIWWGLRSRPAGEIICTDFVASLRLTRLGRELSYRITFEDDGVKFDLRSSHDKPGCHLRS